MITFKVDESSLQQWQRYLTSLTPRMMVEVHRALSTLMLQGAQNIQKYFAGSGPKGGPTTALLTSRSGALLQSIVNSVRADAGAAQITAQFGSSLPYARIQEYGGVAGRASFKKPDGKRPYLPPRPYLQPAFAELESALPGVLQDVIRKITAQS